MSVWRGVNKLVHLYDKILCYAKSLQSCPTLCDPIDDSPPGSPQPWDSPGKNTGVGCHLLLQCVKVKSESEVSQSCPTLHDPMDCSLPGSSVHGIFQARVLEWGAIAFSEVYEHAHTNTHNTHTESNQEATQDQICWIKVSYQQYESSQRGRQARREAPRKCARHE